MVKVIEYVDKSSIQVKALNEMISKQTGKISTLEKSRITDNADYAKAIADKQNEIDKAKNKSVHLFQVGAYFYRDSYLRDTLVPKPLNYSL